MSPVVRCTRCGRALTDPVSRALRIGPECRGDSSKTTRRQIKTSNNILRGVAYTEHKPIKIGQTLTYTFVDGHWTSDKSRPSAHESFGAWLKQYGLITLPAEHLACLKDHKNSAAEILKETRADLDKDQVKLIRAELARISADIKTFTGLAKLEKGESHGNTSKTKR